jgi:hypothetical protein
MLHGEGAVSAEMVSGERVLEEAAADTASEEEEEES